MDKFSPFGRRILEAYGTGSKTELAYLLGFESKQGLYKVLNGDRELSFDKLIKFRDYTKCSLDWLLTGESQHSGVTVKPKTIERLKVIAKEQAPIVFADAEIAGTGTESQALDLLIEYLLHRALVSAGLADQADLLSPEDRSRAARFSFAENTASTLEDRIIEIVDRRLAEGRRFTLDTEQDIRGMIRDIIKEESSPKVPVYPMDLGTTKKTRKSG